MRSRGPVESARGLGPSDHVCWVYSAAHGCGDAAMAFLADGAAQGLRLAYAGPGSAGELRSRLEGVAGGAELLARTAIELLPIEQVYGAAPVQSQAVIENYDALTARALAEGYHGYRVAADVSELVRSDVGLDAFARYELQLDRYMESHPFSAMCAYAGDLGAERLTQLACVHPLFPEEHAPFQVSLGDAGVAYLRGEVDISSHGAFAKTFARLDNVLQSKVVVLDVSDLDYIDHRGLELLERRAGVRGIQVRLRRASAVVRKLLELMDFTRVLVESVR